MSQTGNLDRSLGLPAAVLLGLGSILGTGVYVSLADASLRAGTLVMPAIAVAGLLAMLNGLSSAQLAAAHPVSGGTYEYAYRLLHPIAGFAAGWFFLGAKSASAATAALGLAAYLGLPPITAPALTLAVTALVLLGLRRSAIVNAVLVALSLGALLFFVAMAFGVLSPGAAAAGMIPDHGNGAAPLAPGGVATMLSAAALTFVAFTGYGRVATLGEEVRRPERTIPRAVVLTLFLTLVIYLAVAAAALRLGGGSGLELALSGSASPLANLLVQAGRMPGAAVLRVGAGLALLGVLLNLVLGLSRVVLAMGRRGDLPAGLARLGRAGASPAPQRAVLVTGCVIAAISLTGDVRLTWSVSAVTVLLYYGLTNLAAFRLPNSQRRFPRSQSVAGLVGCVSLSVFVASPSILIAAIWLLAGIGLRSLLRLRGTGSAGTR